MKLRDLFLPGLAILSLLYATTSIVRTQPVREVTEPPASPPRSSYAMRIAAQGIVEPSSESISLGTARSGIVDQVLVKAGEQVKKDQPLLKLRTSELKAEREVAAKALKQAEAQADVAQSQLGVAQAQVKVAQAELAQAKRLLAYAESVQDTRAISNEERSQRALTVATQEARLQAAEASVHASSAAAEAARAAAETARAQLHVVDVELERCVIKAPLDATVLQLRARPGEHLSPGGSQPWLLLGQTQPLYLRADIDEHEAWRLRPGAPAEAQVRGNPELRTALTYVRTEPLVIPKRSLSGEATERVDTRVLQVIFKFENSTGISLYPGQQMDVFIEAPKSLASK